MKELFRKVWADCGETIKTNTYPRANRLLTSIHLKE